MPSQVSSENEVHTRYGYLLKPIRDLFKNWEVDIAAELEEYLQEMEQIKISFDGGQTVMNFAEAALLIQGSACIYSKKVEYLYTLVYQTLDLIASKRQLQQGTSVDDQGRDKDVSTNEQKQEEFLLLDDIKQTKNSDLKETNQKPELTFIPKTPVTLITFDDSKKGSAFLSLRGELLGKRDDFKMFTCSFHLSSGGQLFDVSDLRRRKDKAFQRCSDSTQNIQTNGVPGSNDENTCKTNLNAVQNGLETKNAMNEDSFDHVGGDDGGDDGYDDVDDNMDYDNGPTDSPPKHDGMKLRKRIAEKPPIEREEKQPHDPWQTLDPHDKNGGLEKPFRKGRPFQIPFSVKDACTKKRKRTTKQLNDEKLLPIADFCRLAYHSYAKKLPKMPHKALTYHEFEYIYWIEFRRRQLFQRKYHKLMTKARNFDEPQEQEVDENNNEEKEMNDFDADNDDDDGFDDVNDDYQDNNSNNISSTENRVPPMALEESDDLVVSSYEELVRKYVQGFLVQAQQYVQETDLSRKVKEWEMKVVPRLEEEETHQQYDIHKYGENVLATFSGTPTKQFKDVVADKEPWEICRYFLASLQLANNYNVEIASDEQNEMDNMNLRLLHSTPAHQAISQYRAPSVVT